MKSLAEARIIDVHVHDENTKADINIQFPKPLIPEIICCPGHIVRCSCVDNNTYVFKCVTCGRITYEGTDPYYAYNKRVIENRRDDLVCPILVSTPIIHREIEKYEREFYGGLFGYKIHPNYSEYMISNISIPTEKPLIVHCEVGLYDNINVILDFAEKHCGPIIIAHMGRFSKQGFDRARYMQHVYFDCSSIGLIWDSYLNDSYHLYETNYLGPFDTPEELLSLAMKYIGDEKVVFGSDVPYGDFVRDISIVEKMDKGLKNKLLNSNFKELIKRHKLV